MGVGKPMVFRSWVIQVWVWYLKYSTCVIPYPYPWCHRFSWGGMLYLSRGWTAPLTNFKTICHIWIFIVSNSHSKWFSHSCSVASTLCCDPSKLKLAMDQLFLLKTWNPHFLFTSYLYCLQPSFKMVQPFMLSGHPLLLLLKNLS